MTPLTLNLQTVQLTDEQFFQLCISNRDLKFERNANQELIIMSPVGGETSNRNIEIAYQLQAWSRHNNLGIAFDSSGGFILPNGASRSPDASWINLERWTALSEKQQTRFLPLCPDFVIELLSPSDNLKETQAKMREYQENRTRLGWLINCRQQQVEIYRQGQTTVEILSAPTSLSGEEVLPNFVLDLGKIW